jgi:crotonobetainyl-CoA:carnitine CoA-transferase CaiB-like acyl-CoA transferase
MDERQAKTDKPAPMPLAGITVVELGTSLAAPYATMVLAQLGAEVIKVESPSGGDPARRWGPPISEGNSITYQAVNRDKRSVTVDFSDPSAREKLGVFIGEHADVCVQNMRPKAVDALGLGADALTARNPRLIYCNMGAYGPKGPLSHLPGYDPLIQAFSGICHVTGPADGDPCRLGVPVIDIGTGMWAVIGIQAALMRRHETGQGGVVDVSLFDTAMGWMTLAMSTVMVTGKSPGRYGTRGPGAVMPNQGFAAADGLILITAGTDAQFARLSTVLGCPQWSDDPRYASAPERAKNGAALAGLIAEVIRTRPRSEWISMLNVANVPNAPINTPAEALNHPHTVASGILQKGRDGSATQVSVPLTLDGERLVYKKRAPELGEDNVLLNR